MSTASAEQPATRDRILAAATRLFAEHGYQGASVGAIEAAAGLAPRRGGLYKHFASKRALLDAALAERVASIDAIDERIDLLPFGDLRSELVLIGRLGFAELERERDLARMVMKDGDRFPEIAAAFTAAIARRGHRLAVDWIEQHADRADVEIDDPEAVAQVLIDSLVGCMLQGAMLGDALETVERERFIAAWADAALGLIGIRTRGAER